MDNTTLYDLNALVPASVRIKFGDDIIEVKPPKTENVLRVASLGQKFRDIADLSQEETTKLIEDLKLVIADCVPELAMKELNSAQLFKIMSIINDLSMPPDAKELESRGIDLGGPKAQ